VIRGLFAFNVQPGLLFQVALGENETLANRKCSIDHFLAVRHDLALIESIQRSVLFSFIFVFLSPRRLTFYLLLLLFIRDYCVKDGSNADGKQKPASVHLRAIGNNGRPSWAFPLGLCQGDVSNRFGGFDDKARIRSFL